MDYSALSLAVANGSNWKLPGRGAHKFKIILICMRVSNVHGTSSLNSMNHCSVRSINRKAIVQGRGQLYEEISCTIKTHFLLTVIQSASFTFFLHQTIILVFKKTFLIVAAFTNHFHRTITRLYIFSKDNCLIIIWH